jgi:hypothetical protein|tara:strand:+ start:519 stop:671 length:153 start_codon:yes stop_codon:yes gene_type:complete
MPKKLNKENIMNFIEKFLDGFEKFAIVYMIVAGLYIYINFIFTIIKRGIQ